MASIYKIDEADLRQMSNAEVIGIDRRIHKVHRHDLRNTANDHRMGKLFSTLCKVHIWVVEELLRRGFRHEMGGPSLPTKTQKIRTDFGDFVRQVRVSGVPGVRLSAADGKRLAAGDISFIAVPWTPENQSILERAQSPRTVAIVNGSAIGTLQVLLPGRPVRPDDVPESAAQVPGRAPDLKLIGVIFIPFVNPVSVKLPEGAAGIVAPGSFELGETPLEKQYQRRAVLAFVYNEDDEALLIFRKSAPVVWSPPGGFVAGEESHEAAAVRKVLEETGIKLSSAFASRPLSAEEGEFTAVVARASKEVLKSSDELPEARWTSLKNLSDFAPLAPMRSSFLRSLHDLESFEMAAAGTSTSHRSDKLRPDTATKKGETLKQLAGEHEHPHEPNGEHEHEGLPKGGGHRHIQNDPEAEADEISNSLIRLMVALGGHAHREGDPIEGVHIGTFGEGAHSHPLALGESIQLPIDLLAEFHELRPWLSGFVRAMIRERPNPDAPFGQWRIWSRFDSVVHAIHPLHWPEANPSEHEALYLDESPSLLIQKRYVFSDGTIRAPIAEDFRKEASWLGEFAEQWRADPTAEFKGPPFGDPTPIAEGEYSIFALSENRFVLRWSTGGPVKELIMFGDLRKMQRVESVLADAAETRTGDALVQGKVSILQMDENKIALELRHNDNEIDRIVVRRLFGDRWVAAGSKVSAEKAFHIRGTHWMPPTDGSCPSGFPTKIGARCYTPSAARALRESQKQERPPSVTQALIFDKEKFPTAASAKKWAREHDKKFGKVDEKEDTFRLRQRPPSDFDGDTLRTIELTDGVKAVVGRIRRGVSKKVKVYAPFVHHEVTKREGSQEEQRLVYGVVYEPFKIDAQGDWASDKTIEQAAHLWMIDSRNIKIMHKFNTDKVRVVESYIASQEIRIGRRHVSKGAWILVLKVLDDQIWAAIKSGKLRGLSLGGRSTVRDGAPRRV